jgi:ABC-type nitrate/sulfonate/bicarbonate transport system permease component
MSQTSADGRPAYHMPFAIMTVLFFMWEFLTAFNPLIFPEPSEHTGQIL